MNRAHEPQGDKDHPSGKSGKPNTVQIAIILGIAAGTVIAIVGSFLWAGMWTALGVSFVAAALMFITPAVIFIGAKS
jgi:hypothetical protein